MEPIDLSEEVCRNKKIYRIFEKEHFFEMFKEKKNTLVLPHVWEDPSENLILKSLIKNIKNDGTVEWGEYGPTLKYGSYAQCWGAHEAPDAMWHIYSNKKCAVQVETTVGKLIDDLRAACKKTENPGETCRVLKINYRHETELNNQCIKMRSWSPEELINLSLIIKRKAFEHEREVRLLFISNNEDPQKDIYKYPVEPHALIDQVILDPQMCPCKYTRFKEEIMERTGLNAGKIKQSTLCQKSTIRVET